MIFINNEALHSFSLKDENVGLRLLHFMAFYAGKKFHFLRKATNFLKKVGSKTFNVAAR